MYSLLSITHLIGLALSMGSATAKVVLVLRCRRDREFARTYFAVAGYLTRLIILGLILLTLSGIGWLWIGYPLTSWLVVKLVFVAAIWVMGPVIDKVVEPKFRRLATAPETSESDAFLRAGRQYLAFEIAATLLFYVVVIEWMLR